MSIVRSHQDKDRRRRSLGLALTTAFGLALLMAPVARGDVFVMKLVEPPSDDKPTIEIGGVPVVIDTGHSGGLYVPPASATTLGMDPAGGRPGRARGVGGSTPTRRDVPVPPDTAPSGASTPITPEGQATASPPLPGTGTVGPTGGSQGLLGSGWLEDYEYGRIDGYFWMVAKDQGAEGVATAIAMASFLGLPPAMKSAAGVAPAPQPAPDDVQPLDFFGRPGGTKSALVVPTPPKSLPPDTEAMDGGWLLSVDITDPATGDTALDVPLVIKSGLDMTLISASLAQEMGLDPDALPQVVTNSDFGTMTVRQAILELRLFDDPDFPTFTVAVGIPDPADNPFAENFLGGDVLTLLEYWEISAVEGDGLTRFFAAIDARLKSSGLRWPPK